MREYDRVVPASAVASEQAQRTSWALDIMARRMNADIRPTAERSLTDWLAAA